MTELLRSCWWVVCRHFCHRRWFKQIIIFSFSSYTQEVNRGWWTKGSSETTGVSAGAGVEERKGKLKVLEMEIGPVQGDYRVQQKFMHCRLEVGSLDPVRMKRKTQRGQRLETMTQGWGTICWKFPPPDDATRMSILSLQMNTGGGGSLYPDPPDYDGEQRYDRLDDSRYCANLPWVWLCVKSCMKTSQTNLIFQTPWCCGDACNVADQRPGSLQQSTLWVK